MHPVDVKIRGLGELVHQFQIEPVAGAETYRRRHVVAVVDEGADASATQFYLAYLGDQPDP
jgi:hypothetical protein